MVSFTTKEQTDFLGIKPTYQTKGYLPRFLEQEQQTYFDLCLAYSTKSLDPTDHQVRQQEQ